MVFHIYIWKMSVTSGTETLRSGPESIRSGLERIVEDFLQEDRQVGYPSVVLHKYRVLHDR